MIKTIKKSLIDLFEDHRIVDSFVVGINGKLFRFKYVDKNIVLVISNDLKLYKYFEVSYINKEIFGTNIEVRDIDSLAEDIATCIVKLEGKL